MQYKILFFKTYFKGLIVLMRPLKYVLKKIHYKRTET